MKKTIIAIILLIVFSTLLPSCVSEDTANDPVDTTTVAQTTEPVTIPTDPLVATLKVGSYNVKHFEQVDHDFSVIAQDILSKDLEIVGLQEIDKNNNRSNGLDEPAKIAEALGWEYAYTKTIDYEGGEYGHCIVSKYPIKSFNSKSLTGGGERRAFGHAVIDVNGVEINFINTHLSTEGASVRKRQFAGLNNYVKSLDNFIIVGDFNTEDFTEFETIENATLVNNSEKNLKTFPSNRPSVAIDNIVVSSMFTLGEPKVLSNQHSDHIMLYTEVTYVLPKAEE